jgi:6-phospho-beta-glucosidase
VGVIIAKISRNSLVASAGLQPDDVVEVPCMVGTNGAKPLRVGHAPAHVRDLLLHVKSYERMTVAASFSGSPSEACAALAANPLVGDRARAQALIDALGPSW